VVNKKLSVPEKSTTASALPTADARGHTGRSAIRSAARISIVPSPCDRGDAEYVVDPAHQRAVFDEDAGFHLHVLAEPDPSQHDHQTVAADQLTQSGQYRRHAVHGVVDHRTESFRCADRTVSQER
jgi:hypothetical protein